LKPSPPSPPESGKDDLRVRDLEKRLAEAPKREAEAQGKLQASNRGLLEAQAQQTATSEILRVISSSPTDVQPVFDAIVKNAVELCGGVLGTVFRFDGERLHLAAHLNVTSEGIQAFRDVYPMPVSRDTVAGCAILDCRVIQAPDSQAEGTVPERSAAMARAAGFRGVVAVPMLRGGAPIGLIAVGRRESGLFSDREIALLQTFAEQAVIAIENVRLFTETKEALERQTATSEILSVISRSPRDVQPVFDSIVRSAVRLSGALHGGVYRFDGELVHSVAHAGYTPDELRRWRATWPQPVTATRAVCQAIRTRSVVRFPDLESAPELVGLTPGVLENLRARGARSLMAVPILRRNEVVGAIGLAHRGVNAFSDTHVELLKTFADQAVIAIENVRLFTELQASNRELTTALDTQTATSDILRVISRSQTDVQPVFDAIVRSAHRLLGGHAAALLRLVGDDVHLGAYTTTRSEGDTALTSRYPLSINELASQNPSLLRVLLDGEIDHVPDFEDPSIGEFARSLARARGHRSRLMVPLRRGGTVVGGLAVTRVASGRFSEDEIALLQTFADQAVIAIENVRLFRELEEKNLALTAAHAQTTESLERQTATSEILRVISQSPTDVQPVFDAIVQSGAALCHAPDVIILMADGDLLRIAASVGLVASSVRQSQLFQGGGLPLSRGSVSGRAFIDRRTVHVPDVGAMPDNEFPEGKMLQREYGGHGTTLAVPLLREDRSLGVITLLRNEVSPFTERQVALLQTFADQAVIAIENVRLFKELEKRNSDLTEALDKQTATSEILRVISGSQTDVQPVFDTIIQSAVRLLGGFSGVITQIVGEQLHLAALTSTNPSGDAAQKALWPKSVKDDVSLHGEVITALAPHFITDVESDRSVPPTEVAVARARGYRSIVAVPLLRDGRAVGSMAVTRITPGPVH
jgi:GAF domain-containing protein